MIVEHIPAEGTLWTVDFWWGKSPYFSTIEEAVAFWRLFAVERAQ